VIKGSLRNSFVFLYTHPQFWQLALFTTEAYTLPLFSCKNGEQILVAHLVIDANTPTYTTVELLKRRT